MYIAVDIGGTKTLVAGFSKDGTKLLAEKFPTDEDYSEFIPHLAQTITKVHNNSESVDCVSIAVPGHIEDDTGVIKGFGNLNWKDKDLKSDLSDYVKEKIIIDNDANMGAVGEANVGAGQGKRKVLYLTISTGIGAGVTVDGIISPALKEIEGGFAFFRHDGQLELWEKFASGKAFINEYGKMGKDVDDPKIWKEFASHLVQGIWNLNAIIQPDVIVIGGSMGVHFNKYKDFLIDDIDKLSAPTVDHPPIVQAKYPDDAVINGCLAAARQHA